MQKKRFGRKALVIALAAAALVTAAVCGVLYLGSTRVSYTPPPVEELAVAIAQTPLNGMEPALSTQNYSVVLEPPLALLGSNTLALNFANPSQNKAWLLLDIRQWSTGLLLYRTGRVAPGMALTSLPLSREAVEILMGEGAQTTVSLVVYSFALDNFQSMGEIRLDVPLMTGADLPQTESP